MKPLLIDNWAIPFIPINQAQVDGETRYYYLAEAPWRIILTCRGEPIEYFQPGRTAGALVGWEAGFAGYCHPGQEGKVHTKISLSTFVVVDLLDNEPLVLSEILLKSPRSDKRGGWRGKGGRPSTLDDGEEAYYINVTISSRQHEFLQRLGKGDISSGARAAIDLAIYHEGH